MSKTIGIFFFRPWLGGGTTTFTAHLHRAIEAAGFEPIIYRVKARGEPDHVRRLFGKYVGVLYRNIDYDTAKKVVKSMPTVMSSPANSKYLVRPDLIPRLMKMGMRVVIHDPNEFTIYDHLGKVTKLPTRPICIRPTIQRFYKQALWIPHPYERQYLDEKARKQGGRQRYAISIARIASVKRPKIILEANRLLPERKRVALLGAEFRMYTKQLEKKYGDVFKQSGKTFQFPMTFRAPVELCETALYNVDMTKFPDDGGGSQYAQMEAADAGCVNIMHEDWFAYRGEVKANKQILAVDGPEGLARLLKRGDIEERRRVREEGFKWLKKHDPKKVGEVYMEELLR